MACTALVGDQCFFVTGRAFRCLPAGRRGLAALRTLHTYLSHAHASSSGCMLLPRVSRRFIILRLSISVPPKACLLSRRRLGRKSYMELMFHWSASPLDAERDIFSDLKPLSFFAACFVLNSTFSLQQAWRTTSS